MFARSFAAFACLAGLAAAQSGVVGEATGFAAGVTGGGDATPAVPADIDELLAWLSDDTPRVILLDKEYNFLESEGTKTETGCRPDSNTCGASGQDALDGPNWCSASYPAVEVTYDVAASKYVDMKSDKSIVGVGDKGVIRGKGLRLSGGVSNVIIQNIHITELNPQYIWGGDAITLSGSDMVWIDHVKFSLIGRQMLVTGYETAGRVTVSNCEFDGNTDWSASCNNEHYWTMLFLGEKDTITLANNWIHDTSGRAPKVGAEVTLHAVNNFFDTNKGHNFDVEAGAQILMEGNTFENCKAPVSDATLKLSSGLFNVADGASSCTSALGRECQANSVSSSGDFGSFDDLSPVKAIGAGKSVYEAVAANGAEVKASAGIGKLGSGASGTQSKVVEAVASVSESKAEAATTTASSKATTAEVKSTKTEAPKAEATPEQSSGEKVNKYGQCGGNNYSGSSECQDSKCTFINDWYSQCQ